jgi:hypothetical protein
MTDSPIADSIDEILKNARVLEEAQKNPTFDVTSGIEWRTKVRSGHLYVLPSGLVCRVRNVPFDFFIKVGRIPNSLMGAVLAVMNGETNQLELPARKDIEGIKENLDFVNSLAECAMVSPRLVDNPTQDDEIGFDDLELEDKMALAGLLGLPQRLLERFCLQQSSPMAVVDARPNNPDPTIFPDPSEPVGNEPDETAGAGPVDDA